MGRKKKQASGGAPAWMATFADLATLLMAFFVLLLAFSEMDVVKYKAVSGSMKKALGVKSDSTEITMPDGDPSDVAKLAGKVSPEEMSKEALMVRDMLSQELKEDKLELEGQPGRLIIRLPEDGVFASGSADLDPSFRPILAKVREVLADVNGSIAVAGHTDDIPIRTDRFRSNWDLSTARAVSVVHELLRRAHRKGADGKKEEILISSNRLTAQGYAESRPLVKNESRDTRAQNRRVDIILLTDKQAPELVPPSDLDGDGEADEVPQEAPPAPEGDGAPE
ncbi:MAG: flagellar motor protein MotB [Myxococcota bacterium]|nr:flagellar motor protein MotB [Myxococcota bacterium]